MWNWLGNGFAMRDYDGSDLTWYLGTVDGDDRQKAYNAEKFLYKATLSKPPEPSATSSQ